jgi:hypothetical protein
LDFFDNSLETIVAARAITSGTLVSALTLGQFLSNKDSAKPSKDEYVKFHSEVMAIVADSIDPSRSASIKKNIEKYVDIAGHFQSRVLELTAEYIRTPNQDEWLESIAAMYAEALRFSITDNDIQQSKQNLGEEGFARVLQEIDNYCANFGQTHFEILLSAGKVVSETILNKKAKF